MTKKITLIIKTSFKGSFLNAQYFINQFIRNQSMGNGENNSNLEN